MITCPVPGLKGTSVTNKEASIPPVMPPDAKPHTSSVLLSLVQLSLTHHPLSASSFFLAPAPTAAQIKTVPSIFSLMPPSLSVSGNVQMLLLLVYQECPPP